MKYNILEEDEPGIVSEATSVNYISRNRRMDMTRGISGEELLNRIRPRIEALYK